MVKWMEEFTHLKQGPRMTHHCVQWTVGKTWQQSLLPGGSGDCQLSGKLDIRLVHMLPGKLAEEHAPQCFFDKNNHYLVPAVSMCKFSPVNWIYVK